jgi:hypothetical protein
MTAPFVKGDYVRPKEDADVEYLFGSGQRTPPGPIIEIVGEAHVVEHKDGLVLPYGSHELERADA